MPYALDLLELDEHDEPVGRGLRPPSNGKGHGSQNGGESNAPLAQTNTRGCRTHADAPTGAVATEASPSSSATTAFDLDQVVEGGFSLLLAREGGIGELCKTRFPS
jgi:hypothetical protein